ncbi:hypothetical protein B0A48_07594 [Cryoendolithus antarcticus]|uniref:Uncharacterized protein n=1 Tax=Cryoendolithus antarcticus TaxID=1507870 RepID=A0A1V8T716_9PEZI|nr:hypothetical protein B0A48_07594 [Cryoendolithus antarcticus]
MDFAAYDRQYRATRDPQLFHLTRTTPRLSSTKYSHCLKRDDTADCIINHIISSPEQNTFLLETDVAYFGPFPTITCLRLSYFVLLGMIVLAMCHAEAYRFPEYRRVGRDDEEIGRVKGG